MSDTTSRAPTHEDQIVRLEADQWRPIEEAPRIYGSGTDVELTDGESIWIGSLVFQSHTRLRRAG